MKGNRVILAAHRGDRLKHPENSMSAFRAAIDFGVDMIETDIRMSKDGELVIIHDRSALRTAGVDKYVDEMTLDEIKELDLGKTFSPEYKTERIPTVKEFIDLIRKTEVLVNWELKVYPYNFGEAVAFEVADKLIALIEENGLAERSMINSFSSHLLEYVREKHGNKFMIHGQGIDKCRRSNDDPKMPENELFDWCCLYPKKKGSLQRILREISIIASKTKFCLASAFPTFTRTIKRLWIMAVKCLPQTIDISATKF